MAATIAILLGPLLCLLVMLDAFQTIVLPRRPSGRLRITRVFYMMTWNPWVAVADRMQNRKMREQSYSAFGPFSLLLLLVLWAILLVSGFGLTFFGLHTPFAAGQPAGTHLADTLKSLRTDLYVSGTTLFTLGLGDVTPQTPMARLVIVLEAGTGLGFVALVIGYLPVIYQAFSRREVNVALLDGRAGSPPTATELLRRHGFDGGQAELVTLLGEWERWSAEVLESHISYPILCYYRSQHDNQSWLSALIAILDACALLITAVKQTERGTVRQAQLTFAMARHALIDLGHVFKLERKNPHAEEVAVERLPPRDFNRLCDALGEFHMELCGDPATMVRLTAIRALYEPHAQALAAYLRMAPPLWMAEPKKTDSWKAVKDLTRAPDKIDGPSPDPLMAALHVSERSAAMNLHDEEHGF